MPRDSTKLGADLLLVQRLHREGLTNPSLIAEAMLDSRERIVFLLKKLGLYRKRPTLQDHPLSAETMTLLRFRNGKTT